MPILRHEDFIQPDEEFEEGSFDPLKHVPRMELARTPASMEPTLRARVEAEMGKYFMKELFRARRNKKKRFNDKYIHLVKEYIEALFVIMLEEGVTPIEAFFIYERDKPIGAFSLQWMSCALIEIIDPTSDAMIEAIRAELGAVLADAKAIKPEDVSQSLQKAPPKIMSIPSGTGATDIPTFKPPEV